uniref:Protein C n=1 Tax=Measles morbillivirus TaxID=11234 RepID=E7DWM0_9MONO|nr:C protein [Measles morbillivirus]
MSKTDWNASGLSRPSPSAHWPSRKPWQHGQKYQTTQDRTEPPARKRRQAVRVSANHASQQLDQLKAVHLASAVRDLERAMTTLKLWESPQEISRHQALGYSVIMFMITAVKRLRESKMLTLSWFNQALMVTAPSREETMNLKTAMWILANLIPRDMLSLTGDLLPSLWGSGLLMLKLQKVGRSMSS